MRNYKKRTHYTEPQWVDFVRGCISRAEHCSMRAHLDSGCKECREVAQFYRKLATRAEADAQYQISGPAIQKVLAIFAMRRPQSTVQPQRWRRAA
jgi:hypothetical protein